MSGWGSGYVTDLAYGAAFFSEQSPENLRLACLLNGFETVPIDRGFAYCELGCGEGLTAMVFAAANPNGRFVAVDFNPAHIAQARTLAEASGLANIEFLECSFEDLIRDNGSALPQFDFITLHGVYSWVNRENREAIVRFIDRHLKSGGVVYISYNAMPGWALGQPVQRLLHDIGALGAGRSDRKITWALSLLEKLKDAEARAFVNNSFVDKVLKARGRSQERYLAHEYLNDHWNPMYHADVARDLSAAKLAYVGSASLTANFAELVVTPAQHEIVNGVESPELQETLKDLCANRRFRQDVFVRGPRRMTANRQDALLRRIKLMLTVPRSEFKMRISVLSGNADLQPVIYGAIADALAERPHAVGELLDLPEIRGKSDISAAVIVGVLVGADQAASWLETAETVDPAPSERLNAVLLDRIGEVSPNSGIGLAVPGMGSGISINLPEAFVLRHWATGDDLDIDVLAHGLSRMVAAQGQRLLKDGEPAETEEAALEVARSIVRRVTSLLMPIWQRLWPRLRRS